MITAIKFPSKVALAENQVVFGFKTDELVVAAGTKAVIKLYFSSIPYNAIGKQFKLTFGGRDIVFTSVQVPDGSGEQFRCAVAGDTNIGWTQKMAEDLAANYYVSMLYDISYVANMVTLTAKNVGTDYYISGANISVPGMSVQATPAHNEQLRPFFKVYLQLVSGSKILGEDFLPIDSSQRAYFDVSEYLRGEPVVNFSFPETINNLMLLRNEARIAFYARYGLYYGDEPAVKKLSNTAMFYALPGGVNSMTEARYNGLNTSFYNQLLINHQFLTWHPISKRTQPAWVEKLWFMVHTPLTKVNLKVKLYIDNYGTPETVILNKWTVAATQYDLFEICCGYNRMQLAIDMLSHADATLLSYDVFLTNQDEKLISEVRNFYIDDNCTLFDRQFIYRNSFRMWETFAARGIKSSELQYERVELNRVRKTSFTSVQDKQNYLNTESNKQVVELGNFLTKEEKLYLSELLLSTEVYEIVGGMLYPVVLTGTNKTAIVDDDYLNNVVVEYVYGYTDRHYSVEKSVIGGGLVPLVVVNSQVNVVQQGGGGGGHVVIGGLGSI